MNFYELTNSSIGRLLSECSKSKQEKKQWAGQKVKIENFYLNITKKQGNNTTYIILCTTAEHAFFPCAIAVSRIIELMHHCPLKAYLHLDINQAFFNGIFPILACHIFGAVLCTDSPYESTATVTGISSTTNS